VRERGWLREVRMLSLSRVHLLVGSNRKVLIPVSIVEWGLVL
jgi:hypothetical protein